MSVCLLLVDKAVGRLYTIDKDEGVKTEGNVKIPIVLPLVVYHNESGWTVKRTLGDLIPNYEELQGSLKKYIPNFEYILYDLSKVTKESARLQMQHMISIKSLSRARYADLEEMREILLEGFLSIIQASEKDSVPDYLFECIRYVFSIRDDISVKELQDMAMRISTEGGELVMSVAEKLMQEGREEGIEKGIEKGREEAKIEMARELLKGKSMPKNEIARISNLSFEKIEEIEMELM